MIKPKNKIWFREEGHAYFADKKMTKRIPSHSAIMAEVYGDKFARVPKHKRDAALKLGKEVHLETQLVDQGNYCFTNHPGYVEQWERFKKDAGIKKFDLIELPLFSKKWWYCCTLDRLYKDLIVDIKTGQKYKDHKIQTACQSIAVTENYGTKINRRMNVYLTENTYSVGIHDNDKDYGDWAETLKQFKLKIFGK